MDLYTDTVAHLHPLPPTSHTHSYMHMLSHLFNRQHANTRITHVLSISHTGTSSLIHTACMLIHTHMCINTDTAKSLMLRPGHDNAFTFRQDHIHIHAHNLSHTDTHIFTHSCTQTHSHYHFHTSEHTFSHTQTESHSLTEKNTHITMP